MDEFPPEITTDVLSRLPFKSSVQCRCVCKPWCTILSDSKFPSLQLPHLSKTSPDIFILYKNRNGSTFYYLEDKKETFNFIPIKPFKRFDPEYVAKSFYNHPFVLGCCNGFICLSEINVFNASVLPHISITVFNPITEELTKLPEYTIPDCDVPDSVENGKRIDIFLSGFGFVDSTKEFKLVLVIFSARDYAQQIFDNEVQVHTLGSSNWRRNTGVVPDVLRQVVKAMSVAFVNGCLHWITNYQNSPDGGPLIVSFDLGGEEFRFVPTPDVDMIKYSCGNYQLGVVEDYLSMVECSPESYIQIWVMKKYNAKESWVKQFYIEADSVCQDGLHWDCVELIKLCKNGELLLLCDNGYLISYNITNKECIFLKLEGTEEEGRRYVHAHPFVGSLISLKTARGMEIDTKET